MYKFKTTPTGAAHLLCLDMDLIKGCVILFAFKINKYVLRGFELIKYYNIIEAPDADGVFGRWEIGIKFWEN